MHHSLHASNPLFCSRTRSLTLAHSVPSLLFPSFLRAPCLLLLVTQKKRQNHLLRPARHAQAETTTKQTESRHSNNLKSDILVDTNKCLQYKPHTEASSAKRANRQRKSQRRIKGAVEMSAANGVTAAVSLAASSSLSFVCVARAFFFFGKQKEAAANTPSVFACPGLGSIAIN